MNLKTSFVLNLFTLQHLDMDQRVKLGIARYTQNRNQTEKLDFYVIQKLGSWLLLRPSFSGFNKDFVRRTFCEKGRSYIGCVICKCPANGAIVDDGSATD